MLVALNKIGPKQALPITNTIKKTKMLVSYAATQLESIICFHARDMCVHIESDASYLVHPKALSCAAGHYYMRYPPHTPPSRPIPTPNGLILTK